MLEGGQGVERRHVPNESLVPEVEGVEVWVDEKSGTNNVFSDPDIVYRCQVYSGGTSLGKYVDRIKWRRAQRRSRDFPRGCIRHHPVPATANYCSYVSRNAQRYTLHLHSISVTRRHSDDQPIPIKYSSKARDNSSIRRSYCTDRGCKPNQQRTTHQPLIASMELASG